MISRASSITPGGIPTRSHATSAARSPPDAMTMAFACRSSCTPVESRVEGLLVGQVNQAEITVGRVATEEPVHLQQVGQRPVAEVGGGRRTYPRKFRQAINHVVHELISLFAGILRISIPRKKNLKSEHMIGTKSEVLLAELEEARDQKRCAREQGNRKRNLRTNQNLTEPMLPHASTRTATSFLQAINQICTRALPCRVNSHSQSGEEGKDKGEGKHGERDRAARSFERKEIGRNLWNKRDQLPREECA